MGLTAVNNLKPWGSYKKSDYTVQQWHDAALIHNHDGAPVSKAQCKLPIKTPSGMVHPGGVQAAAAAIGGARGGLKGVSDDQKASAKQTLLDHYKKMKQDPPESLTHEDFAGDFLEHFGVKGMKWGVRNARGSSGVTRGGGKSSSGGGKPPAHTLSDEDLKKHVARMELEKRYTDLAGGKHSRSKGAGAAFAKDLGKNSVKIAAAAVTTHAVNKALKAAVK